MTDLFFWLGTTGGFGILVLLALTSVAVIAFFVRDPRGETAWARLIAPALAAVLLGGIVVLAVLHYATLLGVPPGSVAAWALPASYAAAAVAGLGWGLLLRCPTDSAPTCPPVRWWTTRWSTESGWRSPTIPAPSSNCDRSGRPPINRAANGLTVIRPCWRRRPPPAACRPWSITCGPSGLRVPSTIQTTPRPYSRSLISTGASAGRSANDERHGPRS